MGNKCLHQITKALEDNGRVYCMERCGPTNEYICQQECKWLEEAPDNNTVTLPFLPGDKAYAITNHSGKKYICEMRVTEIGITYNGIFVRDNFGNKYNYRVDVFTTEDEARIVARI